MHSLISRLMFSTQAVQLHTVSVYLEGEQVHLDSLLGILTQIQVAVTQSHLHFYPYISASFLLK